MGEVDLVLFQRRAHGGNGGDPRGALAGLAAAQGVVGQKVGVDAGRQGCRLFGRHAMQMRQMADGTIEQSSIQKGQAIVGGNNAGQGAFTGSGGAVDGDEQGCRHIGDVTAAAAGDKRLTTNSLIKARVMRKMRLA